MLVFYLHCFFKSSSMLFLPLHLIGLHNYIPYKIPDLFEKKRMIHIFTVQSKCHGCYFIYFEHSTILVTLLFGWKISVIYVISLPMLAMLNYRWLIHFKKTMGLIQSIRLRRQSSSKCSYQLQ